MKNRQKAVLMALMLIFGLLSWFSWYYITLPNEIEVSKMPILSYERLHPKFDYLNGLWLMFGGVFFIFLLIFLDLPSFEEIFKAAKRDIYYKFSKK